ncbi:MAG: hypothetical protein FWG06_02290, partial [Clostridiales bacterium]|nr:hypothetical protein [Clostridiales bacterium]
MYDTLFKNRKLNTKKLLLFGFAAENGAYTYITDIAEGQLKMTVTLSEKGTVSATVADPFLNEEYVLHRAAGACGPFVGKVRADYESVLKEISELCFEPDVFKSEQAKKVIEYVRHAYGGELEFLWQRSPKNAVFRRKDTRKWYGALLVLPENKLG